MQLSSYKLCIQKKPLLSAHQEGDQIGISKCPSVRRKGAIKDRNDSVRGQILDTVIKTLNSAIITKDEGLVQDSHISQQRTIQSIAVTVLEAMIILNGNL